MSPRQPRSVGVSLKFPLKGSYTGYCKGSMSGFSAEDLKWGFRATVEGGLRDISVSLGLFGVQKPEYPDMSGFKASGLGLYGV